MSYFPFSSLRIPALAALVLTMAFHEEATAQPDSAEPRPMFIRQYRVKGAKQLPAADVQEAVYPYLGPGRLPADVDAARAALQRAYHEKGYKTVSVIIPMQHIRQGVVMLEVMENPIGRVRVKGARFTSPELVKRDAGSMQEGALLNVDALQKDVVAMNRSANRMVTPTIHPGVEPGTLDIDLTVEDEFPLSGSLELNNRHSVGTSELRLNAALSYGNLWQLDHVIGGNVQIAPENLDEALVYSAYYLAPIRGGDWSVMLQGLRQESDVSTLGGLAVAGRGSVLGLRGIRRLPGKGGDFQHSLTLGVDYKDFDERLDFGDGSLTTPINYYPFSISYASSWKKGAGRTDLNLGVTWSFRTLGGSEEEFNDKRFGSDGGFMYLRGDASHTRDLTSGYQWFAKVQGQASSHPLVNNEQFSGGGLGTVRGYLESEALGDDALLATFEFRSPSLLGSGSANDWRVYAFIEGGYLHLQNPLAGQNSGESLGSVGLGTRGRFFDHFNGSLDAGYPLFSRPSGLDRQLLYTFRLWGDF